MQLEIQTTDIVSPSIGEDVPANLYHGLGEWAKLIGSTTFRRFYQSPASFVAPPKKLEPFDIYAFGTLAHAAILEPDKLDNFMECPNWGFTASEKKDWIAWIEKTFGTPVPPSIKNKDQIMLFANAAADKAGKSLFSAEQLSMVYGMVASVQESDEAMDLLESSVRERSFRAGMQKARPDILRESELTDLKTTAQPNRFRYHALDMRYPESLAWYELTMARCGRIVDEWRWLVVGQDPIAVRDDGSTIHQVDVVTASADLREQANERLLVALERFAECQHTNYWPGPDTGVYTLYPRNQ